MQLLVLLGAALMPGAAALRLGKGYAPNVPERGNKPYEFIRRRRIARILPSGRRDFGAAVMPGAAAKRLGKEAARNAPKRGNGPYEFISRRRIAKIRPPGRRDASSILPSAGLPEDQYYAALRGLILDKCGPTCVMEPPVGTGRFFPTVVRPDQCHTLFSQDMIQLDGLSNRWPPPQNIPKVFLKDFTMGDQNMAITNAFEQHKPDPKMQQLIWDKSTVETLITNFKAGEFHPHPGAKMILDLLTKHRASVANKHCAVFSTRGNLPLDGKDRNPWLEAILLIVGAVKVTTIEYASIWSDHPKISALHPGDWGGLYGAHAAPPSSNGTKATFYGPFDCLVAYSGLEFAGLGRFGDIVNPWADLITMGKLSCSIKRGGLMFVGYPATSPEDGLAWNARRTYGPKRWAQMLANTEQLEVHTSGGLGVEGCDRGMMVVRRP